MRFVFVMPSMIRLQNVPEKVTLARRQRGVFRDLIASLEKLEEKEILLPADHVAVQWLAKIIENLGAEFTKQHFTVEELMN